MTSSWDHEQMLVNENCELPDTPQMQIARESIFTGCVLLNVCYNAENYAQLIG